MESFNCSVLSDHRVNIMNSGQVAVFNDDMLDVMHGL